MEKTDTAATAIRLSLLPNVQKKQQVLEAISAKLPSRPATVNPRTTDKSVNVPTSAVIPNEQKTLKHYFTAEEVDMPALPIDDWKFSLNHLDPALTYTLQLKIYLNSDGGIDEWAVLKQEPEGNWVEEVVEKLKSTILIPATKDGVAVNMVRNIEIFIKP